MRAFLIGGFIVDFYDTKYILLFLAFKPGIGSSKSKPFLSGVYLRIKHLKQCSFEAYICMGSTVLIFNASAFEIAKSTPTHHRASQIFSSFCKIH